MRRRRKRRSPRPPTSLVPAATPTLSPPRVPALALAGAATLAAVLLTGMVDAAPVKKTPSVSPPPVAAPRAPVAPRAAVAKPVALKRPTPARAVASITSASVPPEPWGAALPSVSVTNNNTGAKGTFRLYRDHGSLDLDAMKRFMTVVNGSEGRAEDTKLDARLVQLAFRAAYHFATGKHPPAMTIVSGTRKGAHGKHGTGEALDFKLEGVSAPALAKYVRTFPRAGVGIYTHPKTQYVHVDVRERSYHWIDASPPGVTWREQLLPDPKQAARDASYTAANDLPETAR